MKISCYELQYHLEVCGEGFPLLVLHGFTGDSSTWMPFCNNWGGHSTLLIPDLVGHGRTESPKDLIRYRIESAARDLKDMLEQMKIQQIDVLGYSMGGRLALTFAILYPGMVRKLILESASPGLRTEEEREQRRMKDGELAEFITQQGIPAFVDYWEVIPLFESMKHLPFNVKEKIRNQRLRNSPIGLANSLRGMGTGSQPSWWEQLSVLSCEVLLVTGEKDEKFCRIAESMLSLLNNAHWSRVEEVGHAIHVENKEKFGTIVSDFLSPKPINKK
ncbi:2-succinyl-6-hydroxy-2,4-cyclohexadiene-1-carboxylate synthase [Neobacillus sp. LXY-1]|uniref:2-succinyl-6-hydroxy-2, 4-cyclohexadiene-1-carboxylate synthase n=1 Tax=Neobacillus sp. LXY-1 TaxID=3379133 RepID=UPI003EDF3F9A